MNGWIFSDERIVLLKFNYFTLSEVRSSMMRDAVALFDSVESCLLITISTLVIAHWLLSIAVEVLAWSGNFAGAS